MVTPEQRNTQMEKAFKQIKLNPAFSFAADSAADKIAYQRLRTSLESLGARFHDFTLEQQANGLRGIFTTADILAGTTIMSIPLKAALRLTPNAQLTLSSEPQQKKDRMLDLEAISRRDFYDFISLEPQQSHEAYDDYLQLLPPNFKDSPVFFNEHFLNNTGYGQYLRLLIDAIKLDYISLIASGKSNVPIDLYFWTYMCWRSRIFTFKQQHFMMPVLDLLNHSNERLNCKIKHDHDLDTVDLFTTEDVAQGQELIFSYNPGLIPTQSITFYGIFPEPTTLVNNIIYFYDERLNKYELGNNAPASLLELIKDTQHQAQLNVQATYAELEQLFAKTIDQRRNSQEASLAAANSTWEKDVILWTYSQEIAAYSKAQQLFKILAQTQDQTTIVDLETLENLWL